MIAQVAVSLPLLVGAGLVARTLDAARRADPGFDPSQVTAVELDVKQNGYDEGRGRVFYRELLNAARVERGVESATLASAMPMALLEARAYPMAIEGHQVRRGEDLAFMMNVIGPDYFRTLRIPVRAGREFDDRDADTGEPVAVVNQTFADRFFGGAPGAVGRRIRVGDGGWRVVVGVAADVKYARINEPARPYVYLPFQQLYRSAMVLHTRGAAPVDDLLRQAGLLVERFDPDLTVLTARAMTDEVSGAFFFYNFAARTLFVFGVAGLALAAIGTYGLVSYLVKQSTHEIGIRLALGAPRVVVLRGFVARGLRLGVIGTVLGVIAAFALARLLVSLLYGVTATDLVSFGGAVAGILGGVALATALPAWRAARTNPISALRHQ